jgi:hypothetical protein
MRVIFITGPGVVAVLLKGPKITRIAAADQAGTWITQDLREPVEGQVSPIVGVNVAAYALGRYVYAFSAAASRWDVAELPEGVPTRPVVGGNEITLEGGGHIFTFSAQTGKWNDLDLNAIFKSAEDQGEAGTERKK